MTAQLYAVHDGQILEVFAYGHYSDGTHIAFVRLPEVDGCPPLDVAIPTSELRITRTPTYREAVAELARQEEKAPGAAATATRGKEIHTNTQEGEDLMPSVADARPVRIPTSEEVLAVLEPDDGATTVFAAVQIGEPVPISDIHSVKPIRVSLERFDALDVDGRPMSAMWSLAFIKTGRGDTEICPDRIPELIAVLEGMHATYLAATRPVGRRNEDFVRAAAEIREDLS